MNRLAAQRIPPVGAAFLVASMLLLPGALDSATTTPVGPQAAAQRAATRIDSAPSQDGGATARTSDTSGAARGSRNSSRDRGSRTLGDSIESVIEVAEEVSPEWGAALRARLAEDPEALRRSIATNGRRLIALAVLRDREPDLYQLKVAELRIQSQTSTALRQYREATTAGDTVRSAELLRILRNRVREQVDHDLRTRAVELAALDQQVRRLRERLADDTSQRDARIAEMLDELMDSEAADDASWDIAAPVAAGSDGRPAVPAQR